MPTLELAEPTGRYLSMTEREEIAILNGQGHAVRQIADRLGRAPSTISRELRRNAVHGDRSRYRATVAQAEADKRARRPKGCKLLTHPPLRLRAGQGELRRALEPGADRGAAAGRLPRR